MHVCGNVWVHVCGFWVHIYQPLGACMRMLGASLRRRLGAYMRLLGASFIRLKACLTVGSYCRHVYPTSWAQGPPGPWPKGSRPRPLAQGVPAPAPWPGPGTL